MKKWVVITLATSVFGLCHAASKPDKKEEKAFTRFSMEMLQGDRIDPAFNPIPLARIIAAIEKLPAPLKGETETTAEFNARMAAASAVKFLGESSLDDTFAFVLPVEKLSPFGQGMAYQYDADAGDLRLFALPASSNANGHGDPYYGKRGFDFTKYDQFELSTKGDQLDSYNASNAYGAKTRVVKLRTVVLGLAPNVIPFLKFKREYNYSRPSYAAQVKMDSATAAKEIGQLKVLVLMKPAFPFIRYDGLSGTPTIAKPVDGDLKRKLLAGDVIGLVYYSGITGEILARVPAGVGKAQGGAAP